MSTILDRELATFEAHKPELLDRAEGKFVLIRAQEIAGIYDTKTAAINEGYRRFGNVAFLVKHIVPVQKPVRLAF